MNKHLALYERLKFNLIPLKPRDKRPALTSWAAYQQRMSTTEERSMWFEWCACTHPLVTHPRGMCDYADHEMGRCSCSEYRPRNVGVVTGAVSHNLVVLDFDDAVAYDTACDKLPWLAETLHVSTGRGHHVYLNSQQDPGPTFSMKLDGAEGVHHIKANGGYVVAPPSIHPSGAVYKWDNLYDPEMDELLTIDLKELVPALMAAGFKRSQPEAREIPEGFWDAFVSATHGEGERANALVKLVGILRAAVGSQAIAYELARGWNQQHLVPPLTDEEVRGSIRSYWSRYKN